MQKFLKKIPSTCSQDRKQRPGIVSECKNFIKLMFYPNEWMVMPPWVKVKLQSGYQRYKRIVSKNENTKNGFVG